MQQARLNNLSEKKQSNKEKVDVSVTFVVYYL